MNTEKWIIIIMVIIGGIMVDLILLHGYIMSQSEPIAKQILNNQNIDTIDDATITNIIPDGSDTYLEYSFIIDNVEYKGKDQVGELKNEHNPNGHITVYSVKGDPSRNITKYNIKFLSKMYDDLSIINIFMIICIIGTIFIVVTYDTIMTIKEII